MEELYSTKLREFINLSFSHLPEQSRNQIFKYGMEQWRLHEQGLCDCTVCHRVRELAADVEAIELNLKKTGK